MNSANLLHSTDSIILPDFLRNLCQVILEIEGGFGQGTFEIMQQKQFP